jgi:hypothetical protein
LKTTAVPSPRTQAELRHQIRLAPYRDAFSAVKWVNAAKGTAAHGRVLAVRKELEELGTILDSLRHQRRAAKGRRPQSELEILDDLKASVKMAELQEQFRVRHNALNQTIARYTFVPALGYDLDSGFWRFSAIPKHGRGPEIMLEDQGVRVRVNEASAIAALARLASSGELHRVRLCAECDERWLFSLRKMDKFCGKECRIRFHVHSEEGKRKNRDAQRRFRQTDGYAKATK